MIVNVEQGSVNAGIATLLRLSDALGVGLPSLVSPDAVGETSHAAEVRETTLWSSPRGGKAVLLGGTPPPDVVELWEWTLAPGDRHDSEAHRAGTREIVHVVEGEVQVETGSQVSRVVSGSTLLFDGDIDHAYANLGPARARFSMVVFEPNVHPVSDHEQPGN